MVKLSNRILLGGLAFCLLVNAVPVEAQSELPPWKERLNCDYPQIYRGLEYCTGMNGKARVIVIDLTDPDIRLKYLIANGKDRYGNIGPCRDVNIVADWNKIGPGCFDPQKPSLYPVFSLFDAVKQLPNAAVVIDSDYGAYTPNNRGHGPEGLTVIDGTRIDGKLNGDTDNNAEERPWLAFGYDPKIQVEFGQLKSGFDDQPIPVWIYTAFGGAPWLVKDGDLGDKETINSCEAADPHSCRATSAQTAVGISKDRWLFFVMMVDIENKNIDAYTIAKFMKDELDVTQAIKLDGGGSSQLYYGGFSETERVIYRGDGRWLSHFLGIVAEPGDGITLGSTPPPSEPPSDDTDLNWWQRIVKGWTDFWSGAGNWWEEQKQKVSDWWAGVKSWWQDLPRRMEEWAYQWFLNWLNQRLNELCGSAGLVPITMAVILYSRRRKGTKH